MAEREFLPSRLTMILFHRKHITVSFCWASWMVGFELEPVEFVGEPVWWITGGSFQFGPLIVHISISPIRIVSGGK